MDNSAPLLPNGTGVVPRDNELYGSTVIKGGSDQKVQTFYIDYISGDTFMSDSFPATMSMNDACMEVKGEWVTKGKKVVSDIQDKFNLQEV